MNSDTISYSESNRTFVLSCKHSAYVMRIVDGQVIHIGFLPTQSTGLGQLDDLAAYDDTTFGWDVSTRRYELPTFGDIATHEVAMKAEFPHLAAPLKPGERANLPVRDLRLRYVSHEIRNDAAPGLASPNTAKAPTLVIHLRDASYPFKVQMFYRVQAEYDLIERWIAIQNECDFAVSIPRCSFGTLHVPNGQYDLLRVAGIWAREFTPVKQTLAAGVTTLNGQSLNTGHFTNPIFMLGLSGIVTEDAGTVHFGALAYSGNWELRFDVLPTTSVRVHGGYESSDFELTLNEGESHTTPAFIMGCASDGFGGASRRLHRFCREKVLPQGENRKYRPVLYNSWEATFFNLSEGGQINLAKRAASIGVELFCVDDGWFGARRDDRAGLGDWVVSKDVFPNGLKPLIDTVKQLGMKFGLWVEPEMVNPDSDLYRAHPDWVLHFPGRPRSEMRQQLVLDFGQPQVVAYVYDVLACLLRENKIDFFKWDMNRPASEPGSPAGKAIWRKHVEALYGLWDRLRAENPNLDIQSCSGGGGRVDYGILSRADQVWVSDNTDAHDRVFVQEGFSLAYPSRTMEAWVTDEMNGITRRHSSIDLRFDVAMRGALGIGTDLNKLSDAELEIYRRKIAFYKLIRPTLQTGDLYRLRCPQRDGISAWLTVTADQSQAVFSYVALNQLQAVMPAPVMLRGLSSEKTYEIVNDAGETICRLSGAQLMTLGLPERPVHGHCRAASRSHTWLLRSV